MKEDLVTITINRKKGWIRPTVSEQIRDLTYEEMVELRQSFCTMIAESEELWRANKNNI